MDLLQSALAVLYIIAASQGFFLTLLLYRSKLGDHQANRYLCLLTLLFSLALVDYATDTAGISAQWPVITTLLWPKEFFYGPLIFLYCIELTRPSPSQLSRRQQLHFLPGLLHIVVAWSLLMLPQDTQQLIIGLDPIVLDGSANSHGLSYSQLVIAWLLDDFETVLAFASIAIYLGLSIWHLKRYSISILNNYSEIEQINLSWLKRLLISLLTIYLLYVVTETLLRGWMEHVLGFSMLLLIYLMGYRGLQQPEIFKARNPSEPVSASSDLQPEPTEEATPAMVVESKYAKSAVDAEMSGQLIREIRQQVEQRQLYLEPQLTLTELADLLCLPPHYVSQAINEQTGNNFFDFINSYRTQAAQALLLDKEAALTVIEVAMAAGFNSKSAFYTAFKKHAGVTPSQYKKEHLK
ncbi:AraC family transcriptional regulator [Neptunomonas sp. XY-337]|uniref:helix-turn-helix domain-containing protein n=1 Tax=Neptunomonas sp. XY-337 TaxID=2561897 RepID=UPI001F0F718E|nr:AraC family transcriptional regulator [Neptunomonas sp. XY-337]